MHSVRAPSVRPSLFDAPRSSNEPIDYLLLRQDPPVEYQLAARDVLGVYIEGVLGKSGDAPPVRYSDREGFPPAIGYPVVVREDGTIALPFVQPIFVSGLTQAQVENKIRKAYTIDKKILQAGRDRIIITLMHPRTYHVMVIREDTGALTTAGKTYRPDEVILEPTKRGRTYALELPAYQNDVLHALSKTGGLPGVDAKNEVKILRGALNRLTDNTQGELPSAVHVLPKPPDSTQKGLVKTVSLDMPEGNVELSGLPMHLDTQLKTLDESPNVTTIPLQKGPWDPPIKLTPKDIILNNGDVVVVQTRESEVYYTGGMIKGGQHPLPRDYDLDVLSAIAMAGGSIAAAGGGSSAIRGVNMGGSSICPPTRVTILRTTNGEQVTIRVDLKRAVVDANERILIQPNDFLLLEYTTGELLVNMVLNQIGVNFTGRLYK
jgi:protein involved in polysaccharide export with SLBB domain